MEMPSVPPFPKDCKKAKLCSTPASQAARNGEMNVGKTHLQHRGVQLPAIPTLPRPCRCLCKWRQSAQCGIRGDRLSFSSAFACHLRKRSSGLSGDDTISLGTVPPCSGMHRYSGIQIDPGCFPPPPPPAAEPGLTPDSRASSGGAPPAKSSAPRFPSARISLGSSLRKGEGSCGTPPSMAGLWSCPGRGCSRQGPRYTTPAGRGAGPGQGQRRRAAQRSARLT